MDLRYRGGGEEACRGALGAMDLRYREVRRRGAPGAQG